MKGVGRTLPFEAGLRGGRGGEEGGGDHTLLLEGRHTGGAHPHRVQVFVCAPFPLRPEPESRVNLSKLKKSSHRFHQRNGSRIIQIYKKKDSCFVSSQSGYICDGSFGSLFWNIQ